MQAALQMGLGRKFEMVDEQRAKCEDGQLTRIDVIKSTAVAAQMLLLCGWRAHREVSLLFGEVCELCPLADEPARGPCLLPVDQVKKSTEWCRCSWGILAQLLAHRLLFYIEVLVVCSFDRACFLPCLQKHGSLLSMSKAGWIRLGEPIE